MFQKRVPLILLLALLAACATPAVPVPTAPATTSAEPVTITFGAYDHMRPLYEGLAEQFHAANPDLRVQLVSLDAVVQSGGADESQERRRASAADTFVADAFAATPADTWGFGPATVEQGLVRDLAPFIAADPAFDQGDLYPGAIEADAADRVALLPTTLRLPLLVYNRDLWDARGVPRPTADWSWAELRAAITQLARRDGDTIATYGLMLASRVELVATAELHSLGPLLDADQATLDLASPAAVAGVEELAELLRSGAVYVPPAGPAGPSLHASNVMPLIEQGRLGIWRSAYLRDPAASLPFARGIAPLPPSEQGHGPLLREGLAISAGTQHPEQAWRWLSFLSRQASVSAERSLDVVNARRSIAEASPAWAALDAEGRAAFMVALERLAAPSQPSDAQGRAGFWERAGAIAEAVSALLDRGEAPETALAAARAELDQALASAAGLTPTATTPAEPVAVATPRPEVAANPDATQVEFVTAESNDALRTLAAQFNAQFPQYFVEVREFDWPPDGGPTGSGTIVASGDCGLAWGSLTAADRAQLLDLRPLIDADPSDPTADIPPGLLAAYTHEGRLYGLPRDVTFAMLGYNKELFDAAGLAYPSAGWTLDDFVGAAERLTNTAGVQKTYGFVPQHPDSLLTYLGLSGAPLVTRRGGLVDPAYTTPEVAAALQSYLALLRATSPVTNLVGYDLDSLGGDEWELIDNGVAAMWFTYSFTTGPGTGELGFERGVAPLPLAPGVPASSYFTDGLFISADSAAPQACWAWIRFLLNATSGYDDSFPARSSVAESAAFLDRAPPGAAELYAAMKPALEDGAKSRDGVGALLWSDSYIYWLWRAADRAYQGGDLTTELADAQFFTEQHLACFRGGERWKICPRQVDPSYKGMTSETR